VLYAKFQHLDKRPLPGFLPCPELASILLGGGLRQDAQVRGQTR